MASPIWNNTVANGNHFSPQIYNFFSILNQDGIFPFLVWHQAAKV
jgi:hypothetical protein